MMTVHKLSAGDGYRYYTGEVASADVLRDPNRELGDYYTVEGMPPGQWVGSGAAEIALYGKVSEDQMGALFSGQQLPLTTEELAQLLAQKPGKSEAIYAKTLETQRLEYGNNAWKIQLAIASGKNQTQIGEELFDGISQQAVSKKLLDYQEAGNTFATAGDSRFTDEKNLENLRQDFIKNYQMTGTESIRAHKVATREANKVSGALSRATAEPAHAYDTVKTPYVLKFNEEKTRFSRQNEREPNKEELREIRQRVGGQLFREEHRREPRSNEELMRWIGTQTKPKQQTIAGFDLVFTPTKSVSIAWGLGDETLRKGIETAHEKAIQDVVNYLENNAIYTRRGMNGIAQENVQSGIIATKFRHYDSRNGDPNLHDHLVIANKVQGKDGRWLSLDGRMIYAYNVAASELYNTRIAQHIHNDLGLEFVGEERRGKKIYELAGINSETIQTFSSRSTDINKTLAELEAKFIDDHGHAPNDKARIALRQQATLATRPHKEGAHSLQELNQQWQEKAQRSNLNLPVGEQLHEHLKTFSNYQADMVIAQKGQALATSELAHAQEVIGRLQASRSTWKITHIEAETQRYFRDITSGAGMDEAKVSGTVAAVINQSVALNNYSEPVELPASKLRADGTSVYRRADHQLFSSHAIFQAENSLLTAASTEKVIPLATTDLFERQVAQLKAEGGLLSATQEDMARAFVTDERLLVVGIGPAGAGKTTSMKAAVDTAKASGHTVFALAPTAVAASIMEKELGVSAMTVAGFIQQKVQPAPGDMLLVDEVGMVSTLDLETIVDRARTKGAVVRGIGDYRQLSAIGSGGALRLIESEAGAIYLEDVFRFKNREEAAATLALREPPLTGADKPFDWYLNHERVTAGEKDVMLSDVFAAWSADTASGKESLMLATSNADVKKLNEFAQVAAIDAGVVRESQSKFVLLDDGSKAFVGDRVVTRQNKQRLTLNNGKDFVKNGDLWTVQDITKDGEIKVKHAGHSGVITLPAHYVSESVQLGYASTISRAQGATVDTVHAVVDSSTSRANAYVALSRGRENNQLYVATTEDATRDDVLTSITNSFDRNLSFHEETRAQRNLERNVATNLEKYADLSLHASEEAMKTVAELAIGQHQAQGFINAPAWGALAHELSDAYRSGLDPVELFKRAHGHRDFGDAEDVAAVMQWRVAGLRSRDDEARQRFGEDVRPMAHIPDERLALLIEKAKERTAPLKERDIEDKRWVERDYALVPSAKLQQMRVDTAKALGAAESSGDTRAYGQIAENLGLMDAEVSRRRWSSPAQREVEELVRGERARTGANFTVLNALEWEQKVRSGLLPQVEHEASQDKNRIVKGISGHSLDSFWQYDRFTSESMKRVLKAQHSHVANLVQFRGTQIAAEKPGWAQSLGEVPAKARNARHWYRVAAEVEAFREKYQVPTSDVETVPKSLIREGNRGDFLASQVVDVHKRSRLSSTLSGSAENKLTASATEMSRRNQEKPSDAEKIIAKKHLNTGEESKEKGEHMQQTDDLWSQLETAYQAEQQARTQLTAAQQNVERAQSAYQTAIKQQEAQAQQLMQMINTDFAPIQVAKQRVEDSGLFTRSSRERELEAAQQAFAQKYGINELPAIEDRTWMLNIPEYAQINQRVDSLQEQVGSAQTEVDAAQATLDTAHHRREDTYTAYAEVRDSEPSTAIVSEDMTPAQIKQLRTSRLHVDESLLSAGVRPTFDRSRAGLNSVGDATVEPTSTQQTSVRELQALINKQEKERQETQPVDDIQQKNLNRRMTR